MNLTDPIADMLTRIRNAVRAKHTTVDVPYSKVKNEIKQEKATQVAIANIKADEDEKDFGIYYDSCPADPYGNNCAGRRGGCEAFLYDSVDSVSVRTVL